MSLKEKIINHLCEDGRIGPRILDYALTGFLATTAAATIYLTANDRYFNLQTQYDRIKFEQRQERSDFNLSRPLTAVQAELKYSGRLSWELAESQSPVLYHGRTPVYTHGGNDPAGERAIEDAKQVYAIRDEFAKMAGSEKHYPWLCRIDVNEQGVATKVSWPRLNDMPEIVFDSLGSYKSPLRDKATRAAGLSAIVDQYIAQKVNSNE